MILLWPERIKAAEAEPRNLYIQNRERALRKDIPVPCFIGSHPLDETIIFQSGNPLIDRRFAYVQAIRQLCLREMRISLKCPENFLLRGRQHA